MIRKKALFNLNNAFLYTIVNKINFSNYKQIISNKTDTLTYYFCVLKFFSSTKKG